MGVVAKSVQAEVAELDRFLIKHGLMEKFELFNQAKDAEAQTCKINGH